jgi:threonine synthase
VNYLSTRGHPDRKRFCEILLEGLAPDGGLYLPETYPQVDTATLANGARCRTPNWPSRSSRSTSTTSRRPT